MDIASYLRTQYGLRESNDRKFRDAQEVFEKHRKTYDAENQAEVLYTRFLSSMFTTSLFFYLSIKI
jgi:hypothetical protein